MPEYKYKYEFEYKYKAEYENTVAPKPEIKSKANENPKEKVNPKPKNNSHIPKIISKITTPKKSKYVNEQGLFDFRDGYEQPAVYVPILTHIQAEKHAHDEKIIHPNKGEYYKELQEANDKYWSDPAHKKEKAHRDKELKKGFTEGEELINKISTQLKDQSRLLKSDHLRGIHPAGKLSTGVPFPKSDLPESSKPLDTEEIIKNIKKGHAEMEKFMKELAKETAKKPTKKKSTKAKKIKKSK